MSKEHTRSFYPLTALITEKQASDLTGLSPSWFQRARWKGIGPEYVKIREGRAVRYQVSALMNWIEENRRTPGVR
jgi:hypothetical protein